MKYVDPSFTQDIYADKPWAFSPLLASALSEHAETQCWLNVILHSHELDTRHENLWLGV